MKVLAILMAVGLALASASAYNPIPATRSTAQTELSAALDRTASDSTKLKIAEDALAAHPEDIPLGRAAEEVIQKFRDDPVTFFRTRAEKSESIAAHYLYGDICGRAMGDTVTPGREADWILKKDPKNFWAFMLRGDGEWNKSNADLAVVQKAYEDAVNADPSRPEGYLYLGFVLEDQDKWPRARQALEAGAVCDPANTMIRDQRATAYAQLRDANSYFDLAKSMFPDKPLTVDLPRASGTGTLTTSALIGKNTVIEFWAYT